MNFFRLFETIGAANRVSHAVTNGRKPNPRDIAELGLTDALGRAYGQFSR